jgi:hypothetical protein
MVNREKWWVFIGDDFFSGKGANIDNGNSNLNGRQEAGTRSQEPGVKT